MRQNKNLSGLVETLHVCVCVLEMYLYMSVSVCDRGGGSVSVCGIIYSLCTHDGNLCVYMKDCTCTVRVA